MAEIGIVTGIVGGLVATVVMTVLMVVLGDDSPPPTASLWSKYVGDGPPEDYMMQGMALHFLYGLGAGAVFGLAVAVLASDAGLLTVVGGAVVYGIVLMLVGMVLWMRVVLGMEADGRTMALFGVFHLAYGLVLGLFAWFVPMG